MVQPNNPRSKHSKNKFVDSTDVFTIMSVKYPQLKPRALWMGPKTSGYETADRETRFEAVCDALSQYDIDGQTIYRRIKVDAKEEKDWDVHAECPICTLDEKINYILACTCKKKMYSLDCLQRMEKEDHRGRLFCPFCRRRTLKIHKDWLFEPDVEARREQKRANDRRRTHRKKAAKRKLRKEEKGGEDPAENREEGSSRARKSVEK